MSGKRVAAIAAIAAWLIVAVVPGALATGTADEARELARKAVVFVKANGVAKAAEAFNRRDGGFVRDDLYVFMFRVTARDGGPVVSLAHPVQPGLVGKDLCDPKYPEVRHFIAAMAVKAMKKNGGWVDYQWSHPQTGMIGEKSAYVLRAGPDVFVGCGVYQ